MRIALDRRADRAGRLPLARQIQLHIERLIGQRLLGAGVKLPATRELARDLGVNRTTVALAYDELVAGGWARAHVGQGTFVADQVPAAEAPRAAAPRFDWTGFLSKSAQVIAADARRRQDWSQVPAARSRRDLVRGGHAGQRPLPHRRVPPGAQPRDPRGGAGAAAVLSGARLPAAARIPGRLPAALRPRGPPRGDPHRQRLAAGLRPRRADAARPRRLRGHRAAVVSARDAGVSRLRRPALARADGVGRARRRGPRAAPRAPVAQARLLPAERPQSDRAHDDGARAAAAPGGGGAPPAARSWRTASTAPSSTASGRRRR